MKNNNCFYCLNSGKGLPAENNGWYHPCKFDIENENMQDVESCPKHSPNKGFQIGGYYSHMHFEFTPGNPDQCLEWIIHSDGEFPTDDPYEQIRFHICDFEQIEGWVKYWGDYLRKMGAIEEDDS